MNIDFESLTDPEINRWAAERDPMELACGPLPANCVVDDYAESADAALALCERWGLRVDLLSGQGGLWYCAIGVFTGRAATAARALLNAACAARHAKETADANFAEASIDDND